MWVGDVRKFMEMYYKAYFYKMYIGNKKRYNGLKRYKEVYTSIMNRISDINDGIIVTREEMSTGQVPEEYIPRPLQHTILDTIIELHEINEERSYYDDFELLPVSATAIIIKNNGNIKNRFIGFNKVQPDFNDLKIFKEKYVGSYPRTIHAEVDAMYKAWRKYSNKDCGECTLYLVVVRNGHNTLSRPCIHCRRMIMNTNNEIGFKEIVFIYPMIDDLIVIEKFHQSNLNNKQQ